MAKFIKDPFARLAADEALAQLRAKLSKVDINSAYPIRFNPDGSPQGFRPERNKPMPTNTPALNFTLERITADISRTRLAEGVRILRPRVNEFDNRQNMMLTGLAMLPESRAELDRRIQDSFIANTFYARDYTDATVPELIIGGGVHAAIYAATRVRMGFPRPLVLDAGEYPGGAFAYSRKASFYLNSENRPGALPGLPKYGDALNALPGALLQASEFTGKEFPTNADMAFVVRLTLAQNATVIPGMRVESVDDTDQPIKVTVKGGRVFNADRVIDARGLGMPNNSNVANGDSIMTFPQFMARMDTEFPMQGYKRVAVIGGGDSAKCAIEALVGIGPESGMRPAALDTVDTVDWYARNLETTNQSWAREERGRYRRIASYLPDERDSARYHQVTINRERGSVTPSLDSAIVNGRNYDHVVLATGFETPPRLNATRYTEPYYGADNSGVRAAVQIGIRAETSEFYRVGPVCDLSFNDEDYDAGIAGVVANRVSIFRYANRTAAVAASLKSAEVKS